MKKLKNVIVLLIVLSYVPIAFAQFPSVSKKLKVWSDSLLRSASRHSDSAWVTAYPIIVEEARHGRPYVPWGGQPDDFLKSEIPAFPGAEGGGAYTPGGRGGRVIVVTNLADNGPGTFREACERGGARIVVFNVSGIIRLKTPIILRAPYITIAGQTAPGDGVCIAGETFQIDTHDVIIRHMRFRRGETNVGRRDNSIGGKPYGNIIIDHTSISWGLDENISIYDHLYNDSTGKGDKEAPAVNVTIQNSIISEALDTWNHAYGGTLGGRNNSYIRNLWSCNTGRNPVIAWSGTFNFINNILFNWVSNSIFGGDYHTRYNIINNYFKPGPLTPKGDPVGYRILKPESGGSKPLYNKVFGRCYVNGNIMEGNNRVTHDNWDGAVQIDNSSDWSKCLSEMASEKPFQIPQINLLPSNQVFDHVLADCGALLPRQDTVDKRVINTVRTGIVAYNKSYVLDTVPQFKYRKLPKDSYKYGIITDIRQVGGYPEYKGKPYKDSDNDGMPDDWEKKYNLNLHDPSDAVKDCNGDGYTNIEKYINNIDPAKKVDWKNLKNNYDTLRGLYSN